MEINSVVISLDRLRELELIESKKNEPRSKTIIVHRSFFGRDLVIETDDEYAGFLANELKEKQEKIERLEKIEIYFNEIKEMSLFELIKWKLSNKK